MQLRNIKALKELDKKRSEIMDKIESVKEISEKAGYDVKLLFRTKIEFIFASESTYTRYNSIENHPNDDHDKYHEMNTNCIKTVLHVVEECLNEQLKMVEDDIKALK